MCSLGKRVRSLVRRNWLSYRVERNQVSSPNPSLSLSLCGFIVTIVGEMAIRVSFASRRSMRKEWQKEWANKDRYNPSHGVPKSRMPLPRGKAVVRTVLAREKRVFWEKGTLLVELNHSN
jgi:hypothetical protein